MFGHFLFRLGSPSPTLEYRRLTSARVEGRRRSAYIVAQKDDRATGNKGQVYAEKSAAGLGPRYRRCDAIVSVSLSTYYCYWLPYPLVTDLRLRCTDSPYRFFIRFFSLSPDLADFHRWEISLRLFRRIESCFIIIGSSL